MLLDPSLLTSTSEEGRRLIQELEVAERLVRGPGSTASGSRTRGRTCDLLTLELLLERPTVRETLTALALSRPPRFVYESALNTLEPLAEAVRPHRPTFDDVLAQLRRLG